MDTRPVIITHTGLRPYIILIPNITRSPVVIAKIYFFIEKSYPYADISLITERPEKYLINLFIYVLYASPIKFIKNIFRDSFVCKCAVFVYYTAVINRIAP